MGSSYSSSGKNQGKLRTNQLQLTPTHLSSGLRTKKEISCAQIRHRQPGCFRDSSKMWGSNIHAQKDELDNCEIRTHATFVIRMNPVGGQEDVLESNALTSSAKLPGGRLLCCGFAK